MAGEGKIEQFVFGGVDSRSNPANYPSNRAIRMRNFRPLYSGQMRLRYGYTAPAMTGFSAADGEIHSAAYYEKFDGTQALIFGQGRYLKKLDIQSGAVTTLEDFGPGNTSSWGHFRAGGRLYLGGVINGQLRSYDGTTLRVPGIRAASNIEASPATAVVSATAGTWAATLLTGYQLYMVYYNTVTGMVGNRVPIGARFTVPTPGFAVDVANLPANPDGSGVWVKGIGRTNDGGEVPYWLIDTNGNRIVVPSGSTTITIPDPTVDAAQELPTRNTLQKNGYNKFARVGQRIFAARDGDPFIYYTEDETDSTNGNYVGLPYESWPGNNAETFPTGEVPTSIHAYRFEGWFFSKTHLAIWSQYLLQQGTNPWRGPWPVGCAGQRAWLETPYGPYWVTPDKELMGFNLGGPVNASDEYQASLLGKIGDQYVSQIELGFLRDPQKHIDQLVIKGKDANGAPVVVIHDFIIKDARAPQGQGYEAVYSGMIPSTFVGAGYTPRQNARDTNGRERLWCGSVDQGRLFQLEDGTSDNGAIYSGDWIGLVNVGPNHMMVNAAEWQGDTNVAFSWLGKPILTLPEFTVAKPVTIEPKNNITEARISDEARWLFGRIQLDSHPADGNFDITDPPFLPFPSYGLVNYAMAKLGTSRSGAR